MELVSGRSEFTWALVSIHPQGSPAACRRAFPSHPGCPDLPARPAEAATQPQALRVFRMIQQGVRCLAANLPELEDRRKPLELWPRAVLQERADPQQQTDRRDAADLSREERQWLRQVRLWQDQGQQGAPRAQPPPSQANSAGQAWNGRCLQPRRMQKT